VIVVTVVPVEIFTTDDINLSARSTNDVGSSLAFTCSAKAMISSFMYLIYFLGLMFPKNLKNSLSGDKITEVSPPIKAVS